MTKFEVIGKIVPKERPRFANGHVYTPKKTQDYETLILWSFQMSKQKQYHLGPLRATIEAHFTVPQSYTLSERIKILENIKRPTMRPDCDNIAKTILDACNKTVYKDDSQIVELIITKKYGDIEKVIVTFEDL